MKQFTEYLMEIDRKYEFAVRLAGCDTMKDLGPRIESALAMYKVESVSSGRRLPIQEHSDFIGCGPCEVQIFEVALRYPTITPQIRQIISDKLNIPAKQVIVRTQLEESQLEPVDLDRKSSGPLLLNQQLEAESAQPLVGQSRIDSMLKQLQTRRYEIAGKAETAKAMPDSSNTHSPVGSKQNTIPSPVKGK